MQSLEQSIFWSKPLQKTHNCATLPGEIRKHLFDHLYLKDESKDEKQVFQIYYDFSEKIANMQGYRTLA